MNLLSAVLVAAAAGLIVVLVRLLTGLTVLGIAAGVGFAAAPIAWRLGTRADPHALHVALVAILLVFLVAWEAEFRESGRDRWLLGASIVFGVSLANHSLTVLLAPPIALYLRQVDRGIFRRYRLVATCALLIASPPRCSTSSCRSVRGLSARRSSTASRIHPQVSPTSSSGSSSPAVLSTRSATCRPGFGCWWT
jgi:hypothetical protein